MSTETTLDLTKKTLSVVLEGFLLEEIERFRHERLRRSGHLSRSGAVRLLVARGLEGYGAGERSQR